MSSLDQLKEELIADGIIDAEEVEQIRNVIYSDGVIDSEEVDFLFEVNDAVSGNDNDPAWNELFAEAVASNILEDGVIDDEETSMLVAKIEGDGTVDQAEKKLLLLLKEKSETFPAELEALLSR
jgi:uncharacterized membrane protein YebE (DUF533 family)